MKTVETSGNRKTLYVVCGLSARAIGLYVPELTNDGAVADAGELVALVDVDAGRMSAFLERENLSIPTFGPDQFDRMVDETRPDCAIITTPDGTHVDYIVAALNRNLDVICEKPMVIDCEQAKRVFAAELTSKGSLQVTHNSRYTPGHMLVKQMIGDGLVGRITNVDLSWNIDTYHGASYFYRWNRDRSKSGGMSITKGCHHFDLLNWWIGDVPEEVFAFGALNYYGAKSPHNPSVRDGIDYSPMEQRDRCGYHQRWFGDVAAPADDHLTTLNDTKRLPNDAQYPEDRPIYLYDEEISIEDTYSAVIRYRGGASVSYSANFSAPWEGYTLVINGTHGRIEKTERLDRGAESPEVGRELVTYYPIFGEAQVHEAMQASGTHGGADPLLLQNLFVDPIPQSESLGLKADSLQATYAVAVGEAVWRSVAEHRPIRISELLGQDEFEGTGDCMTKAVKTFQAESLKVLVFDSIDELGQAAAENTASIVSKVLADKGSARVIFATGNSQFSFVEALRSKSGIDWSKVTTFHMDEYVGMSATHPASFRKWIRERIEEQLHPGAVNYLEGDADDIEAECRRFEGLLREAPIDLICMGIGENGHIAFNDPPVADFNDPVWVKVVELDTECRLQQVGEGHFPTFDDVPTHALTLTIPALIAPDRIQVVAPETRKAQAVRDALEGPISTACPASILRKQANATLFLDRESSSLLAKSGS